MLDPEIEALASSWPVPGAAATAASPSISDPGPEPGVLRHWGPNRLPGLLSPAEPTGEIIDESGPHVFLGPEVHAGSSDDELVLVDVHVEPEPRPVLVEVPHGSEQGWFTPVALVFLGVEVDLPHLGSVVVVLVGLAVFFPLPPGSGSTVFVAVYPLLVLTRDPDGEPPRLRVEGD
jgi:hypothetical protein